MSDALDLASGETRTAQGKLGRGRFLVGLGSAGLAAATTMFCRVGSAAADGNCACCNLVYCPPNTDYNSCINASHYLWSCAGSGTNTCECCEKKDSNGFYIASAYECEPH